MMTESQEPYARGYKEGYWKAYELFHKQLELAMLQQPIQIVIKDKALAEKEADMPWCDRAGEVVMDGGTEHG
jgi:hypothetical protein